MNTIFVVRGGKIEAVEPTAYWNTLRQQAQDAIIELTGGEAYVRKAAEQYLDDGWRQNLAGYNVESGETEAIEVTDAQWIDYRNDLLDEVERIIGESQAEGVTSIAERLNGRYDVTADDLENLGGKWSDAWNVFIFPDFSYGGFTDLKDGATESVLHFVGHAPDPENLA